MYIDSITISDFRSFEHSFADFVHPAQSSSESSRFNNINLVIGANGSGKTTLLKAICLAALGPAVEGAGIFPYHLVRRAAGTPADREGDLKAVFTLTEQDRLGGVPAELEQLTSQVRIAHKGDLERLRWTGRDEKTWHPVYSETSDAVFSVGYGATRRVEKAGRVDQAGRRASAFTRAGRLMSLFEEAYSLLPLSHWLPHYRTAAPDRFNEVTILINDFVGPAHYRLTGERDAGGEFLFRQDDASVPFPALSDGYRALLGWFGDLLYHLCETSPADKRLREYSGIVMVDEVDLHIHPVWQMDLLPRLADCLPNIQFIVTSHSPLLVGSLEWRNILIARERAGATTLERVEVDVSRLDADQILLTDLFGLKSTRSREQTSRLRELLDRTRRGEVAAAEQMMAELSGSKT